MRAAVIALAVIYCTICDDGHGHKTTEWHWQGMTITKQTDDPYDLIAHPPTGAKEDR